MESDFAGFTFQKQEFVRILLSKSVLILTVTCIFCNTVRWKQFQTLKYLEEMFYRDEFF